MEIKSGKEDGEALVEGEPDACEVFFRLCATAMAIACAVWTPRRVQHGLAFASTFCLAVRNWVAKSDPHPTSCAALQFLDGGVTFPACPQPQVRVVTDFTTRTRGLSDIRAGTGRDSALEHGACIRFIALSNLLPRDAVPSSGLSPFALALLGLSWQSGPLMELWTLSWNTPLVPWCLPLWR